MRENTPMSRAIDEHLALALPGWGAPGGRFVGKRVRKAARGEARVALEAALRAESIEVLNAITVTDIRNKFGARYQTAQRALATVRHEHTQRSLAA